MLSLLSFAAASSFAGLDYVPFGRADLTWTELGQGSGTLVGSFDGLLAPPLSPYLGLHRERFDWIFGLTVAHTATTDWTGSERHRIGLGGVRPSVDLQKPVGSAAGLAHPWLGAGTFVVIPFARDRSTAFGEEEQQAAREANLERMSRVGGAGLRAGAGVDLEVVDGLSLGMRAHLNGWLGERRTESSLTVSTLVWADAGLRLQFEF